LVVAENNLPDFICRFSGLNRHNLRFVLAAFQFMVRGRCIFEQALRNAYSALLGPRLGYLGWKIGRIAFYVCRQTTDDIR
jgi:hypothetical protein